MGALKVGAVNTISELATKTNTSNTFFKTIENNDVYLTISANKRVVGTSAAHQFKFQIFDNQGTTFTDAWIDVRTIDFNITTKKAKLTVKDSLFIDTTEVLTTLNAKADTTSVSSHANLHSSSLSTFTGVLKPLQLQRIIIYI